jgi:ABC-2 type transport system ATP-binding protein
MTDVVVTASGVRATPSDVPPERVVEALVAAGVGVRGFAVQVPSLEDLFVALTGEGFDVSR